MTDRTPRPAPRTTWATTGAALTSRRLDGWTDGYTADAAYLDQVGVDHSPAWYSWVAAMHGQPGLPVDRPLVWLDIGCGTGLAACSVAAANPNVEVWGVDYNPAHVERATHLARSAGLANCRFAEASFQDLAADRGIGPTEVDVVVVNGVYSWISAANRARIVAAIGDRLRPGGLAMIMYEAASGWSSMPPLAEALRLAVEVDRRPGDLAFHDAAEMIRRLDAEGALYFPVGPREAGQMEGWADADPGYAAHEYLGRHFEPLMADEVVRSMAGAKCQLIGTLGALDHHLYYSTPPEFADLLGELDDPVAREMVRDLILEHQLRRDLFRRGIAPGTDADRADRVAGMRIRTTGRPFREAALELPAMQVHLDPAYHVPLIETLAETDLDVEAVLSIHPGWDFADAVSAMGLQVAAGYATPLVDGGPSPQAIEACRRLDDVLLAERVRGHTHSGFADPSSGAMYELDLVQAIGLDGVRAGLPAEIAPLTDLVAGTFERHDRVVREEGRLVRDPGEARAILERRIGELIGLLPALRRRSIL